MGYRDPQERGSRRVVVRRTGVGGFPGWDGLNKEGSTAEIGLTQFRHLENVRWRGDELVCRGGQDKLNGTAFTGCVDGIFAGEFDLEDPPTVLYRNGDDSTLAIGGGSELIWFLNQSASGVLYYDTNLPPAAVEEDRFCFGADANTVWLITTTAAFAQLYEIKLEPRGTLAAGAYPVASATKRGEVARTVNEAFQSVCFVRDLNLVLVAFNDSGNAGDDRVYSWDGTTFAVDYNPGFGGGTGSMELHPYDILRETLLHFTSASEPSGIIHRRNVSGTWASLTMPSGGFIGSSSAEVPFGTTLFIGGWYDDGSTHPRIITYDGTSLTTVRSIASETGQVVKGMTSANGVLYYLHSDKIGTFDGITWTDNAVDLTALSIAGDRIAVADGKLWSISSQTLYYADLTDLTTWTLLLTVGTDDVPNNNLIAR